MVFADHGEYLGEHRLVEHSKDVYQEAMWVPLIVKAPRQTKGRVEPELRSLVHVPSMILEHVPGAEGLLPSPDPGDQSVIGENYFTRWKDLLRPWGSRFQRTRHVLYRGTFKYIHSTDGNHELYDLAADPYESRNLIEKRPELATALAQELVRRLESGPGDLPVEPLRPLTEEEIKRLKALGYL